MNRGRKTTLILSLLTKAYGRPRPFKATDPVDELVRTILSQNTNDRNSLGAFRALKKRFNSWNKLLKADTNSIAGTIRHAGLSNIKAWRIKEILAEIKRREGTVGLSPLKRMDVLSSLEYLKSFKGVGPKTAACVLLFSFHKPIMPVDTHIFRVAKRLGLIKEDAGIDEAHRILTEMVLDAPLPVSKITRLIYELHLGIIEHGRKVCRAQNPRCGFCVLYGICKFPRRAYFALGGVPPKALAVAGKG